MASSRLPGRLRRRGRPAVASSRERVHVDALCGDAGDQALGGGPVRLRQQPVLLEAASYRLRGHSVVDPARYRWAEVAERLRAADRSRRFVPGWRPRAVTRQAVIRDDQVTIGTTMALTLSIDHRVLDGATGAAFLADLKALIEEPLRIVL
jgi:hypothetical protein